MSSTRTLVTLLRPWIRRFTIIISAWWLRTSSKFTWEEVKTSTGKLGKWSTPKRVRIRPKHSALLLSRDRRIKMHQSINQVHMSGNSIPFAPTPRYLSVTLNRSLTFRQRIEKLNKKMTSRDALVKRLAGLNWGACFDVLRVSTLSLVVAPAE